MAIAFKLRVGNLAAEFLAHTLVFLILSLFTGTIPVLL